jgi:Galactosyltransferase
MNEGKSQTWFYYASLQLEKYGIEYVMKMDTDSLLYLDRYFTFADHSLPPAPYNSRIMAGAPVDKAWWKMDRAKKDVKEPYFNKYYSTMHLYAAGQMYILSYDLARDVAKVAATHDKVEIYKEGHEDHDVSMMVFLALEYEKDHPIKYVILPYHNPFWLHNLKLKFGISNWKKAWDDEIKVIENLYGNMTQMSAVAVSSDGLEETGIITTTGYAPRRTTPTASALPNIGIGTRKKWLDSLQSNMLASVVDEFKLLDVVQINNTIAPTENCFLRTGHLERPIKVVEFSAGGAKYWSEFAKIVQSQISDADIIILNEMDVGMARSGNVQTAFRLAQELSMNFAWGIESVELTNVNNGEGTGANWLGFTGQAILSKCNLYDPLLIRENYDENQMKESQRVGSNAGLFVRTGNADAVLGRANHIVVGSIHKVDAYLHKWDVWNYQFGHGPSELVQGTARKDQIGSIVAGDMSRAVCKEYGLQNVDRVRKRATFPADCATGDFGHGRYDFICGNLMHYKGREDESYLPCYKPDVLEPNQSNAALIQISNHSVISILLH